MGIAFSAGSGMVNFFIQAYMLFIVLEAIAEITFTMQKMWKNRVFLSS